jgi:hypothetical protein
MVSRLPLMANNQFFIHFISGRFYIQEIHSVLKTAKSFYHLQSFKRRTIGRPVQKDNVEQIPGFSILL